MGVLNLDPKLVEQFALAQERESVLSQLVPNTTPYFYYTTLHALNQGDFDGAHRTLAAWAASPLCSGRNSGSSRERTVLESRYHLLNFERDPAGTTAYLCKLFGVRTEHVAAAGGRSGTAPPATHPASLDTEKLLDSKTIAKSMLASGLGEATQWGLENVAELLGDKMTDDEIIKVLQRLQRVETNAVEALVFRRLTPAKPMKGLGFGRLPGVDNTLTLAQMSELLVQAPHLRGDEAFVSTYFVKLAPGHDDDLEANRPVRREYIHACHTFARTLPPALMRMRIAACYRLLEAEAEAGEWPVDLLLEYLGLSRQSSVATQQLRKQQQPSQAGRRGQNNANSHAPALRTCCVRGAPILSAPVNDDKTLVSAYLERVFFNIDGGKEPDLSPFEGLVEQNYLRQIAARTGLMAGAEGALAARFAADLSAGSSSDSGGSTNGSELEALRNQVSIEFCRDNRVTYGIHEEIELSVAIKNVPELELRVYEINTFNYYRRYNKELTLEVALDGLVPNMKQVIKSDAAPIRLRKELFSLPQLSKPGTYVIEFVGAGRSSRAVVRKGQLFLRTQPGAGAQRAQVVNARGQAVPNATVWIGTRSYDTDENGRARIPFATGAVSDSNNRHDGSKVKSPSAVIITAKGYGASLSARPKAIENYELDGSIHIEREALWAGNNAATVAIRPRLLCSGTPVSLLNLQNSGATLTITVEGRGNAITRRSETVHKDEVADLASGAALVRKFAVPPGTRHVDVCLEGSVYVRSSGDAVQAVSMNRRYNVNAIDESKDLCDIHLARTAAGYTLAVRGRNGEPVPNAVCDVVLVHAWGHRISTTLQTETETGAAYLGKHLTNIMRVEARLLRDGESSSSRGQTHVASSAMRSWSISAAVADAVYPSELHCCIGEVIHLPYLAETSRFAPGPVQSGLHMSLMALGRDSAGPVSNLSAHISIGAGGNITLSRLPAGNSRLRIKAGGGHEEKEVLLCVTRVPRNATRAVTRLPADFARAKLGSNPYQESNSLWQCDRCFVVGALDVYHDSESGADICTSCAALVLPAFGSPSAVKNQSTDTTKESALEQGGVSLHGAFPARFLAPGATRRLHLQKPIVDTDTDTLRVRVDNASSAVRVHVFTGRIVPLDTQGANETTLCAVESSATGRQSGATTMKLSHAKTSYASGRRLGEEHAYVLARRRGMSGRPGNMLPRPSLVISSRELGTTETRHLEAAQGDEFMAENASLSQSMASYGMAPQRAMAMAGASPSIDWLASPSAAVYNLELDEEGVVTLPLGDDEGGLGAAFKTCGWLTVVAISGSTQCVSRTVHAVSSDTTKDGAMAAMRTLTARDCRLVSPLPSTGSFTEQRVATTLQPGEVWYGAAAASTEFAVYDSMTKVHDLLSTLLGRASSAVVNKFAFMATWNALEDEGEKLSLYGQHACHELNFFLARKDGAFFESRVKPMLEQKVTKDVVDFCLLEADPTPLGTSKLVPERLSAFELCLLAANPAYPDVTIQQAVQHLKDRVAAQTPDVENETRLFSTALRSGALDADASGGVGGGGGGGGGDGDLGAMVMNAGKPPPMAKAARGRTKTKARKSTGGAAPRMMMRAGRSAPASAPAPAAMSAAASRSMVAAPTMAMMMPEEEEDQLSSHSKLDEWADNAKVEQLYRGPGKAHQLEERSYWLGNEAAGRHGHVKDSSFWVDWASHLVATKQTAAASSAVVVTDVMTSETRASSQPDFVSSSWLTACNSTTEMMLIMGALDLPCGGSVSGSGGNNVPSAAVAYNDTEIIVTAPETSACIVFSAQITSTEQQQHQQDASAKAVLVHQQLYDPIDPCTLGPDGKLVDKVFGGAGDDSKAALARRVLACRVVVTNPSSQTRRLSLLRQIPEGALPVSDGCYDTRCRSISVPPYGSHLEEFHFYFPQSGEFALFPAQVAVGTLACGAATAQRVTVVDRIDVVDTASWQSVLASGRDDAILTFLRERSLDGVKLSQLCFKLVDATFYTAAVTALRQRLAYDANVWGYAFVHKDFVGMREFLSRATADGDGGSGQRAGGGYFGCHVDTPLLRVSATPLYTHTEFEPVVNARAHQLGTTRRATNASADYQYQKCLQAACFQSPLGAETALELIYHLLLQDRFDEAEILHRRCLDVLGPLPSQQSQGSGDGSDNGSSNGASTSGAATEFVMQRDYLAAYLDFSSSDDKEGLAVARAVAAKYTAGSVSPRWDARFSELRSQLAEIDSATQGSDSESGGDSAGMGAAAVLSKSSGMKANTLELAVKGREIVVKHTGLKEGSEIRLNLYVVDLELSFSSDPFQSTGGNTNYRGGGGGSGGSGGGSGTDNSRNDGNAARCAIVMPNYSMTGKSSAQGQTSLQLPAQFSNANVVAEAQAGGIIRTCTYFGNALECEIEEKRGTLRVTNTETHRPCAKAYVKVYARAGGVGGGKVRFHKDGYTDLRGRFDYAAVNTDEPVERFAVLVVTRKAGSLVRETLPP